MAGQLWNSVAGFCLGDSPSFGSAVALQKLPASLAGGLSAPRQPCCMAADSGHAGKLLLGEHSHLLTPVTNQIPCSGNVKWGSFSIAAQWLRHKRKVFYRNAN